jgi:PAS domain S-box-containing protein
MARVGQASPEKRRVFRRTLAPSTVEMQPALDTISIPSYMVDRSGLITWENDAAIELFGDARGQPFTNVVPPEARPHARMQFLRNIFGRDKANDFEAYLLDAKGRRVRVEVNSAQLREGGQVVGMFGVLPAVRPALEQHPQLTPRQNEVLDLLAQGASTAQIAETLQVSIETVRNHIAAMLRALGCHSRLEAVARARELGLLRPGRE